MLRFICVLLITTIVGCKTQSVPQEQVPENGTDTMSYLALGDSYTIGESVAESDRWPVQLVQELNNNGVKTSSPKIIARTGWTTDELKAGIASANVNQTYGLVSLLIGVNNQFRGRSVEQFRGEFIGLLNQAIGFAGENKSKVFVVSIPDWGVTPFAKNRDQQKIAREIDAYNAVCEEEAAKLNVKYFNITPISREAVANPALIASDGLHPSGQMYQRWVKELIVPELVKK